MTSGQIIVGIATLVVAGVLVVGLYSLFRGGDFAKTYSNKLMRLRILAQFIAVVIIMAVLYLNGRGP